MSEANSIRHSGDRRQLADVGRAARRMCDVITDHAGHIWFRSNGEPCWCTGVNVVRWYNAVAEQQGRDRAAEQ